MDNQECYNEDCYLDINNSDVVKIIYGLRDRYMKRVLYSAMHYGSNIEEYYKYIKRISYLVKSMSIPDNAISASIVLNKLTKTGMFSDNYCLVLRTPNIKDIAGFLGINIIRGEAVCRHITGFQGDVLGELNLMSEPFYCYVGKKKLEDAGKVEANHVINLILYKDNLYGYDAMNDGLYQFVDDSVMEEMFTPKPHYIYYKPYMDIVMQNTSVNGANNLIDIFSKIKEKEVISQEEYNYILYWADSMIKKNSSLLDDFHESGKKYIRKITNHLD